MTPADIERIKKLLPTSLGSAEIRAGHYIPESDDEEAAEDKVASSPACGRPNPEKRLLD